MNIFSLSRLAEIFENMINRIGRAALLKESWDSNTTLAYSGGRDSTLCLSFYQYLNLKYNISLPSIYHLNHQIRDNSKQEEEISTYLNRNFTNVSLLKKKFRFWLIKLIED